MPRVGLAYCTALQLDWSRKGPFILAAGFGNTSLLEFAMVSETSGHPFLAFVGGLLLSMLIGPTSDPVYKSIMDGVHIAGAANTFLVTLAVGLFLSFRGLRDALLAVALVATVKLLIMPVLVWVPTGLVDIPLWQIEVAVLEAAMPSAMLTVVLASSYGCDARFACKLVLATSVLSVVTVPLMFGLLV